VAAVLVGAGTLLVSAIATYLQAAVTADQLEQSRRVSEQAAREQAALVSHWTEDGRSDLHIMNRSQDPIHNVELMLRAWTAKDDSDQPPRGLVVFVLDLGSLRPCSEIVISEEAVGLRWKPHPDELAAQKPAPPGLPRGAGTWRKLNGLRYLELSELDFVDRDGIKWNRDGDNRLERDDQDPIFHVIGGDVAAPGRTVRTPQAKPLATCKQG
jgi:hypothetical protein